MTTGTVWWLPGFLALDADPLPVDARLVPLPELVGDHDEVQAERLAARVGPEDVLVGYSMGARAALAAVVVGARPRALVLLSGTPGLEDAQARDERRALDDARAAALLASPARFVESWQAEPIFLPARQSALWRAQQEARRRLVAAAGKNDENDENDVHAASYCRGQARALRAFSTGRMPSLWGALPAIPVDTVWMAGALDVAYASLATRAAALMPHARAVIVPDAGHVLPLEAPAAVAHTLEPIIAAESRTRGAPC